MTKALSAHPDLLDQLRAGWVLRTAICDQCSMARGVSAMLIRWAREGHCIVERRHKSQPGRVLYHLRPATPGETAGTLLELDGAPE